jgi:cellulose biosynthesis protein BcsQ
MNKTTPARIICLASAKGGSGKTVIASAFAQVLSGLNKKVLLIDTDGATNGLTLVNLQWGIRWLPHDLYLHTY